MKNIKINSTHTARYFISLYGGESLSHAVESAAQKERGLIGGLDEYCKIPIDIKSIAHLRSIKTTDNLPPNAQEDGLFVYSENGSEVKLNPNKGDRRIRYTLAHEIGHHLFYKEAKHQIGLLNKEEAASEDRICEMFASALLMPLPHIKRFLLQIPNGTPWDILIWLEDTAREFQVSIPALTIRLGQVNSPSSFSGIFLYLRYLENAFTKLDPSLRVQGCSSLGRFKDYRTWRNRTAVNINLTTSKILFELWSSQLIDQREPTGGRYTFNEQNKLVRASSDMLCKWGSGRVRLSVLENGHWPSRLINVSIADCLYVGKGWNSKKAYVISIMR